MAPESNESNAAVEPAKNEARIGFAVLVVLLMTVVLFSQRFFDKAGAWISEDPQQALKRFDIFVTWIGIMSIPLLIAAVFTFRSGYRSVMSKRYPPTGMWLIVDTPIQQGDRAVLRGRMMQTAGVLMGLIAVGFPIALWWIVHSIA